MKQTITLNSSFSNFFSASSPVVKDHNQTIEGHHASTWVFRNLMAYSAALFVAKTKHAGNSSFLLN
jgi:hypothetical protein